MTLSGTSTTGQTQSPRAGFWRRMFAITIDMIVVALPFQVIGAYLFQATDGRIQETFGFRMQQCVSISSEDLAKLSAAPNRPAQLEGINFGLRCTISLLGVPTAHVAIVGRQTTEASSVGNLAKAVTAFFYLSPGGKIVQAFNIDWLPQLVIVANWLVFQTLFGRTLGMWFVNTRLVRVENAENAFVPFDRVFLRNMIAWLPVFPLYVAMSVARLFGGASSSILMVTSAIAVAFSLWTLIDLIRKRDPFFDRFARTAVLRTNS